MKNFEASFSDPKGKGPMSQEEFENPEEMPSESTIDDFCQYWLLHNKLSTSQPPKENLRASFSSPFGNDFQTPNSFPNIPESYLQIEPTLQPESTSQLQPAFQPEPFENHVGQINSWARTKNAVELLGTITDQGREFDKLVEDSWAYISKLYSRKRKSTEPPSSKNQINVRPKRSYQWVECKTTLIVFGEEMDISGMPTPVCSCTGIPINCRRWCGDGWTSDCCTTTLSMYSLPTYEGASRIVRLSGRKMGRGTFTKVVEELLLTGYDLEYPIDLKNHWAKHGTNKFGVIR